MAFTPADRKFPPDSVAAVEPDAARLPRANPREVAYLLRQAPAAWPQFATVADRAAWQAIADRLGPAEVERLVAAATAHVGEPIPELRSSQWRAFVRTGDRNGYQQPWYARRNALADLLIGYSLQPDEQLLDAIVDVVWAVCEETSWCFPAHDRKEFPDPAQPVVDLFASLTAVGLAELAHVLRPVLPEPVVTRIENSVQERVITPYVELDTWHWMYAAPGRGLNNWTAVCTFGSAGAACYLERDEDRLATILCKAARSMEEYLEGFDPDGGTSEGTGYWGFGFGSFCQLADIVARRTGGTWDWLTAPIVRRVAEFPLRSRLTIDSWPNFSDSDVDVHFAGPLLLDLGRRFDLPDLRAVADTPAASWDGSSGNSAITGMLRSVHAERSGTGESALPVPTEHSSWFSGLHWLLSRVDSVDPNTLAVAVKGGHNAEMHNQNDIGSLIIRSGGENLVVDPGRGLYTRDYFNQHRYEHFVNRSFGHSVPRPAGVEQEPGARYHAEVLDLTRTSDVDSVRYDLTSAYPESAQLRSLHRTVELHRDDPQVRVVDEFAFAEPAVAETAFVTFAAVQVKENVVSLAGDRAKATLEVPADAVVELHDEKIALSSGPADVTRIAVRSAATVGEATLAVTYRPE